MGGTNEIHILGLRAHVSNGQVHLHDDNGRKFEGPLTAFKSDLGDAVETLKSGDGCVAVLGGTSTALILGKWGRNTFAALTTDSDATDDLKRWAEGC